MSTANAHRAEAVVPTAALRGRLVPSARRLALDDLGAILPLARAMHAESPFESRAAFSAARVAGCVTTIVSDPTTHAAFVLELKDAADALDPDAPATIAGFIAGILNPYTFSHERFVAEIAFYVAAEHRRTRGPQLLLDALGAWGKQKGARELVVGIHTEHRAERIGRFLEHVGFGYMGGFYKRPL